MRMKVVTLLSICVTLSCGPVIAAIDFHGYDDDLMRDLDKTIKYFEPDITAKNADAARDDAAVLQEGFKYTEAFFAKNGAEDAVKISREGTQRISDALNSSSGTISNPPPPRRARRRNCASPVTISTRKPCPVRRATTKREPAI